MEGSVNQRIRLFIDYLGINDNQFAKNICITQSVIASMFSRKTEPSTKVITAILNTYANLSAEWLLRGEGNMIKHEKSYNSEKLYEENSDIIYHFTSFGNLMKILLGKNLLLSPFCKSNDPKESNIGKMIFNGSFMIDKSISKYLKSNYKQCSFCGNYKTEGKWMSGIDHPRMWSQYAENHSGGCIVLNKINLIAKNELDKSFFKNVKYVKVTKDLCNKCGDMDDENIMKFINKNKDVLFFEKYIDWEQEHEIKLVSKDKNSISIDGCIEYVCLGLNVEDEVKRNMKDMFTDIEFRRAESGYGHISENDYI